MAATDPKRHDDETDSRAGVGRAAVLSTIGKVLLGIGLLLFVFAFTILRDDRVSNPHASGSNATTTAEAPGSTTVTMPTTTTTLTALQHARAENGYLVVVAESDPLKIYDRVPPGSVLTHSFPRQGELGVTATFWATDEAIDDQGRTWYLVHLPVRPNGTTGWVKATDVSTSVLTHDVRIDLSERKLELYDRGALVRSYTVGVGKDATPTPPGEYYVTIKMKPPDPNGVYGALAMGLSGFSEGLTDWPGGGQLGVHGTNDPGAIGSGVSAGCIRLTNESIMELSNDVHLGTPVFIEG